MLSADATAERSDDRASSGFIPIALDTLLPSAAYDFDLYLREARGGRPTLYRRSSYPLAKADIQRLVQQGVRTLHVLYEDRDRYAGYLKSLLANKGNFTPAQKYSILKSATRSMLSETICNRSLDAYVENVDELSQQMVELICSDELLMRDMFSLMTHDYYSYTHVTNVSTYCLTLGRHLGIHDKTVLAKLV